MLAVPTMHAAAIDIHCQIVPWARCHCSASVQGGAVVDPVAGHRHYGAAARPTPTGSKPNTTTSAGSAASTIYGTVGAALALQPTVPAVRRH
jgi:hypothetical protein